MKLSVVETRLAGVDVGAGQDLVFELLTAYGTPQASITKLRSGTYDKAAADNETLWKRKVWDIYCLLYTSPSPRDRTRSRMPSSA